MAARIHEREEAVRARQEGSGFRPKASVRPPSPEQRGDIKEENTGDPVKEEESSDDPGVKVIEPSSYYS
jgi:hypothetical protein